ncbi:hypothetical protein KM043_018619 [Ampulex compressa]|nr:hypothetical protein KM043_018619 [Ampulex compressa]
MSHDRLKTQVEIFARQGKDIQSCTHVLKENGDEYKVQYINATADCAANVEIVLSREGKNLGKLYAAGANLLKELKRTNCTESTDVQLCKSTAATKLTDIKARFKSMRKQANHNHIHAISALKSCLENPVKTLDRQVQELQTSTANCLRNL